MNYSLDNNQINLSTIMEQNKNQFTKSEHKIFHYITNNFEEILYKSLIEIANGCHIGEVNVLHFCSKLGFKSYQDYMLYLLRALSTHQKSNKHDKYISKVKNNMVQNVEDTCALVDDEQLQQSIQMIYQAKNVVVYGVSSSGIAGLDMQNR